MSWHHVYDELRETSRKAVSRVGNYEEKTNGVV